VVAFLRVVLVVTRFLFLCFPRDLLGSSLSSSTSTSGDQLTMGDGGNGEKFEEMVNGNEQQQKETQQQIESQLRSANEDSDVLM